VNKDGLKLIVDEEYEKLYLDEVKQCYVLWLIISHVMWYDIFILLEEKEVKNFLDEDGKVNLANFKHFANYVALHRPGLFGKTTPWDERILFREERKIE
jgi:hypothetical protein